MTSAVLPVWRSPMISSRWPRPIGTSASIAFSPVCTGSCTERRGMMPGALTSTRVRVTSVKRALAVDRVAEPVDDAAQEAAADRHVDDRAGALDDVALADAAVLAEDDDADIVAFEVEGHAPHPVRELDHLAGLDLVEPVDASDAVADRQHLADLGDIGLAAEIGDLLLQDRRNFRRTNFHQSPFRFRPSPISKYWQLIRHSREGGNARASAVAPCSCQGALDPRFRGNDEYHQFDRPLSRCPSSPAAGAAACS